jgi:hypothetical protein
MIFPLYHTILTSNIERGKLMFETQITTKGFESRVFKFSAIIATIAQTTSPFLSFFNLKIRSWTKPNISPCHPKRRPKHNENSHPLSPGCTISHPPSEQELDQPSPYGITRMASLS